MKRVVISCGPIPARLDSVKYITNRFKGGLAFKTAEELINENFDVTIIKWKLTEISNNLKEYLNYENVHVVDVNDVFEYYNWYKDNALNYDAFIMSAAVANLTPSNPYEGKFPSHNYQVGEKFNIEFEIAPRAIDLIKQINPRCCLIGYKLFDATSDSELIDIAKHTLIDSKANIVFANTPKEAKTRKIALFQDNTHLDVSFDEHIKLIIRAINQEYFKTKIIDIPDELKNKINLASKIIDRFEETIDGFGTIGIKVSDKGDFVTTSRGHRKGFVYIKSIDYDNKVIYASDKATLNAPVIGEYLKKYDYFIHRHQLDIPNIDITINEYLFPGTKEETETIRDILNAGKNVIIEKGHGYLKGFNYKNLDWNEYYKLFPEKYFGYPEEIKSLIISTDKYKQLDVGCNNNTEANFYIDPNIDNIKDKTKLNYSDLKDYKFDLITLKNSINYLNKDEIKLLINALNKNGLLIANTFNSSPDYRLKDKEAVYKEENIINHYLIDDEENIYYHQFKETDIDFFKDLGFEIIPYNKNSLLLKYKK